jgi:hydroxypyruvate isomerase
MPRFAANLSMLFAEVPFTERFAAARRAGFKAVEFQFPYEHDVADLAACARDAGLDVVLFNLQPGNFAAGERGIACHPGREQEFTAGVDRALAYASALGCKTLNCLAGLKPEGLDRDEASDTLITNLRHAATRLAEHGIGLVIEAINGNDMPGFLLTHSSEAMAVINQVGVANLKLQYDVYHMQRSEGDLMHTMSRLKPHIGHIQIADAPERHEPGTGEINFAALFAHIDAIGYEGWVGCEYKPRGSTIDGLSWLTDFGMTL